MQYFHLSLFSVVNQSSETDYDRVLLASQRVEAAKILNRERPISEQVTNLINLTFDHDDKASVY